MPTAPILINGRGYSYASFSFNLGATGIPIYGITSIDHSITQEKTNNYGAGENPTERGLGVKEFEGSMTLQKREIEKLRAVARDGDITNLGAMNLTITASIEGDPGASIAYVLNNLEFTSDAESGSQGDTELTSDVPFIWAGRTRIG